MSRRLRTGLIIAAVAVGVIIVGIAAIALTSTLMVGGLGARSVAPAYESGYGGGGYAEEGYAYEAPAEAPMVAEDMALPTAGAQVASTNIQIERLIIRNGSITVSVEDTLEAEQAIEAMVAEMAPEGAFVVSSNQYGSGGTGSPYISMQIRVPATRFDEAIERIKGLAAPGTVPSVSESAQDVTEEYVDVQSRLESLEAARDRLLELMQNAETTEDLLMAEQQLTYREAEIESLKGRLNYLAESARLSSISIELQPYILSQPVDTRWRPAETVRRAVESLIDGMRGFADFLITFVIAVVPFLLIVGLIIWGIVRFIQWRIRVNRARKATSPPSES